MTNMNRRAFMRFSAAAVASAAVPIKALEGRADEPAMLVRELMDYDIGYGSVLYRADIAWGEHEQRYVDVLVDDNNLDHFEESFRRVALRELRREWAKAGYPKLRALQIPQEAVTYEAYRAA